MSVKLYNKKTGHTAACERADWMSCRDHNSSKGWTVFVPEHLNTPERKKYLEIINGVIDNDTTHVEYAVVTVDSYNDSIDDLYESPHDDMKSFSEDYNTRASALRDKLIFDIRQQGLGSGFYVSNINPDDDSEWTGNCTSCGARVSNFGSKGWEHTISYNDGTVENVSHCPF